MFGKKGRAPKAPEGAASEDLACAGKENTLGCVSGPATEGNAEAIPGSNKDLTEPDVIAQGEPSEAGHLHEDATESGVNADSTERVNAFLAIVGEACTPATARILLKAADGNVERALNGYLDASSGVQVKEEEAALAGSAGPSNEGLVSETPKATGLSPPSRAAPRTTPAKRKALTAAASGSRRRGSAAKPSNMPPQQQRLTALWGKPAPSEEQYKAGVAGGESLEMGRDGANAALDIKHEHLAGPEAGASSRAATFNQREVVLDTATTTPADASISAQPTAPPTQSTTKASLAEEAHLIGVVAPEAKAAGASSRTAGCPLDQSPATYDPIADAMWSAGVWCGVCLMEGGSGRVCKTLPVYMLHDSAFFAAFVCTSSTPIPIPMTSPPHSQTPLLTIRRPRAVLAPGASV